MKIDELFLEYPEYNKLIIDALSWLDIKEPTWNLETPIDRELFINELVEKAMIANKNY